MVRNSDRFCRPSLRVGAEFEKWYSMRKILRLLSFSKDLSTGYRKLAATGVPLVQLREDLAPHEGT
jgi:hypothetical protein